MRLATSLGDDQHAADPCIAIHALVVEQRTACNRLSILWFGMRQVVTELRLAGGVGDLSVEHDGRMLVAEGQRTSAASRGVVRFDSGRI